MKQELTDKQKKMLNIIKEFIDKNGYSPSIRDLCESADIKSTATIYDYLTRLRNKGYIEIVKGKSRTIRIIEG